MAADGDHLRRVGALVAGSLADGGAAVAAAAAIECVACVTVPGGEFVHPHRILACANCYYRRDLCPDLCLAHHRLSCVPATDDVAGVATEGDLAAAVTVAAPCHVPRGSFARSSPRHRIPDVVVAATSQ